MGVKNRYTVIDELGRIDFRKICGCNKLASGMSVALGGPASSPLYSTPPMIRAKLFRSLPAIVSAFVLASCSDSSVSGPSAPADSGASPGSGSQGAGFVAPGISDTAISVTGLELRAAWWKQNQSTPVQVSQTIGPSGGTISIPATGLTVSFPAGAVDAPITITITADEKYVAYRMAPAGTRFLKDVTLTQSLSTTEFSGRQLLSPLFVAYIANDTVQLSGNVPVDELQPSQTVVSPLNPLIPVAHVWIIRHFSRYMLASG